MTMTQKCSNLEWKQQKHQWRWKNKNELETINKNEKKSNNNVITRSGRVI
jgi:hypothetical protein